MQYQSPYDYKTLAMRAKASAMKLREFRQPSAPSTPSSAPSPYSQPRQTSPKSVDVSKYSNLSAAAGKATVPQFQGSVAKEGHKFGNLGVVTVPYGGTTRYSGSAGHNAVDIANEKGTPIPAFTEGTVVEVDLGNVHGQKGYGNTVIIKDKYGGLHRYSHLENVYKQIQPGTQVQKGQVLGGMGDTGQTYSLNPNKTGVHLHYDLRYNGKYVDPFAYLITNFYNKNKYG